MTTITIDVTTEDIAMGKPTNCHACPIYLAVVRAMPHLNRFLLDVTGVSVRYDRGRLASLPESAQDFISRFDAGQWVRPFSFSLEVHE